jgi:hypothetical protein
MELPDRDRHSNRHGHRPLGRVELAAELRRTDEDLHVCPDCRSELVQPIEWAPVDMRRWRVELRCPECNWESAGVFSQHVLDRFDAILDDGASVLLDNLSALEHSNMEQEVESFVAALETNVILPEDF